VAGVQAQETSLAAISQKLQPSMTTFTGAVMVADVTGFTQLTEILSKRGASGVELLTTCMNSYFTKVRVLAAAGGGGKVASRR
jgi:DNA polymerase III delta subunit